MQSEMRGTMQTVALGDMLGWPGTKLSLKNTESGIVFTHHFLFHCNLKSTLISL